MPDVLIRTTDFQARAELGTLVAEIGARLPDIEVEIDSNLGAEALNLIVTEGTDQTVDDVTDGVIAWARNRLRRAHKEGEPNPRPIVVTVWGNASRKVLMSLQINHPDKPPEDLTTGKAWVR